MIHNVFFWLKDGLSDEQVSLFETELAKLPTIDVVASGTTGKPAPTEERPVTDHSFSYPLGLSFDSIDDQNVYQDHPDHHVFVDKCKDLWDRVVVYDSE